ncbi:hypothetical protein CCZ01_05780 [Helicobacter monodelphidis]|uniref:GDSL-type esterase/lipase family protein n=1 Tax=Helicobacter sp. 15-1451 TaxID=2004995 RepID=UPI000DCD22D4|nr:GDSL-type esterase/lipase family protein [Helicobacter sp. 15-1451]RAX57492.1 hypothetical protein CCZ01_05780 [Helicobacter sp. 15-1451]
MKKQNKITKFYFLFFILFFTSCHFTEEQQTRISTYEEPLDRILYRGQFLKNNNEADLYKIAKKLMERKNFKIRVFGDSHMAGDFFSDELRSLIFKDADSPGFIYPLQPKYQQNMLVDYSSTHFKILNSLRYRKEDYPLGGIIAKAEKSQAKVELKLKQELKQKQEVMIVFRSPNASPAFIVQDKNYDGGILRSATPNSWSFATYHLEFPIKITAIQKEVALGGYFITQSPEDNIIDTLGINGASSNIWQHWNQDVFKRELYEIQYDLFIIAYGANDVIGELPHEKMLSNIRQLIRTLKDVQPNAAILLITPPSVTKTRTRGRFYIVENFFSAQVAYEEFAKKENILLFNTHEFMENSGGKGMWIAKNLSKKDLHLTPLGYRFIARKLFQEIQATIFTPSHE